MKPIIEGTGEPPAKARALATLARQIKNDVADIPMEDQPFVIVLISGEMAAVEIIATDIRQVKQAAETLKLIANDLEIDFTRGQA